MSHKQNWLHFLFVVIATVLTQQISKFYPHIICTEASYHIYTSQWPVTNRHALSAILKITKIAILRQQIDRSLQNLARLCKMNLLTIQTVKKFEFSKSKTADSRILKNVKLPYLHNQQI